MANQPQKMENVEHLSSQGMKARMRDIADNVSDRASEYYDDASVWLRQNYKTTLAVVGVLTVVGIAGFFISKQMRQSGSRFNEL